MGPSVASIRSPRPERARGRWRLAAAAVVLALCSGGIASAQIPSTTGLITGCYVRGGPVRLIDAEAGDTCRRSEIAISWNQTGQQGPPGEPGEPGEPGTQSLGALQDTSCTRHDGGAGYVDITIDDSNVITFTCLPGIPHWCDTNTPTVGPHLNVICDEPTDSLSYICDLGYVDFNSDHADGCEQPGFEATVASVRAFADAYVLGDHDITISPTCAGDITIACPGGIPLDPAPVVQVVGSSLEVEDLGGGQFAIVLDFAITTPVSIPVASSGLECVVDIDTAAGASEAAVIEGVVSFPVNPSTGITDRIDTSAVQLVQVDPQDFTLSGNALCDFANALKTWFVDYATTSIEQALLVSICRAPDPAIFMECPSGT